MIPATEIEYWSALGNLARVQQAVAAGQDVNIKGVGGYTGLHAAAENNHLDVMRFLLEKGAEVDPHLDSGQTPLDLALMANQPEAANLLREFARRHPPR